MTPENFYEIWDENAKPHPEVWFSKHSFMKMMNFAEAYHEHEIKQEQTELLSAGSYDQLEMKQDEKDVLLKILFELRKDVNELKTNLKNY